MKSFLLIATFAIGILSVNAQDKKPDEVIKVNTEKLNFGTLKQNVPVTNYIVITNISNKPVVIENAWGSCGCTTPEIPKEPIAPKATAKLKVQYNAAALNHFEKDVYIKIAGIQQPKTVKVTGTVLDENAYNAYLKEKGTKKAKSGK
jgi:hypothetical protein